MKSFSRYLEERTVSQEKEKSSIKNILDNAYHIRAKEIGELKIKSSPSIQRLVSGGRKWLGVLPLTDDNLKAVEKLPNTDFAFFQPF